MASQLDVRQRVQDVLQQRGLSTKVFAKELGFPEATVAQWLGGQHSKPLEHRVEAWLDESASDTQE